MKHRITVAFSTHFKTDKSLKARLIQFFDKSNFDHALIIIDGKMVSHSIGDGLTNEELGNFLKRRRIVEAYSIDVNYEQLVKAKAFAKGSEGKIYSVAQLIGIVLAKWFKLDGVLFNKFFVNGLKRYICSEYAAEFLEYIAGIRFPDVLDLMTPRELRDHVVASTKFKEHSDIPLVNCGIFSEPPL